jgi:tripartite-type tricarboxylate transporter receptor subunit TctC
MTTPTRNISRRLLPALLFGLAALGAQAQEFPIKGKAIRVIVGFPPGIGVDAQARAVTPRLSELLGTPVIVDNRPGAGTLLAAQELIKAAPDGHTIFYSASSTLAQIPHTLKAVTFDPFKDFTPISMGAQGPLVLVVSSSLGVNNVRELIAYGKANPGKLSYASFGVGTSAHIFGQIFANQSGLTDLVHVPYKGGAEVAPDLYNGRVQIAFSSAAAGIGYAQSGKAKILAVGAPKRTPLMPDVPTLAEFGLKNLDLTSFLGWYGPANMPPAIVKKLNAALVDSHSQNSVKENFKTGAYTSESSTPEELDKITRDAYQRWGQLIKEVGIEKN